MALPLTILCIQSKGCEWLHDMNNFSKAVFPVTFVTVTIFLLFFGGVPGFRDGAHFYAPLFQYLHDELAAGRLPLWNPYENLGQPLAANPTTAFFYPGTLIALGISLVFRIAPHAVYAGYVGGHLLLALFLCYRLSRSWNCSREAATLAALCYALSGNILFQWNNVPFLVGAAWLPEAIRQADRILNRGKIRYAIGFGVVLTLMILGGDPQMAYNALLCAVIQGIMKNLSNKSEVQLFRFLFSIFRFPFLLFLLSGVITFFLAAVQILPAWELGMFSDRTSATHQQSVYSFSVPPWRFVEFLLPNAGGWQFPENARWFSALPFDNEIWVPSFYMGLLPIILALSAFYYRQSNINESRFNTPIWVAIIIFLFFALGSLGNWFFVYPALTYLPGYGMFRYPAKLLVVATLMLAILAAFGFDRLQQDSKFRRHIQLVLYFYFVPVLFVLIIVLFRIENVPVIPSWKVPNCPLFGPFNTETARTGLLFTAFSVSFCILAANRILQRKSVLFLLLPIVAFDLVAANTWMLATVPNHERNPVLLFSDDIATKKNVPARIYRFPVWYPPEFETNSSKQRLAEAICWDKISFFPKYTLPLRIGVVDVQGTLMPNDYAAVAGKLRSEWKYGEPGTFIFETHLARLGVQYVITPKQVQLHAKRYDWTKDVSLWAIPNPLERNYVLFEPNRLVLDISLLKPETIIILEQYWRGWRAFLESGEEVPIKRVEDVFRGVDLPAGNHRLTMIYDPPLFKLGAVLSLIGIVLTLTLFFLNVPDRTGKTGRTFCFIILLF
ncbi:MAG: YfhO family protein [Planctomycetaceae bacterium]|jgi:hypothetical protein|nr:YfhO family protein [Planctomycetaceae bacterium]